MDRLTSLVENRLLLAGTPAFEAPYSARAAIAFARALGITEEAEVVRFAAVVQALGPALSSPEDRGLILAVLQRRDVAPAARLDFIERTWPARAPTVDEG